MSIATAKTKYVRVSPRKARLAGDMIRGKDAVEALLQLTYSNLKAGRLLKKTLVSAIANAENNNDARREDLYISELRIDEGSHFKRSWPCKSRGRRALIIRRTSHFTIALDSIANRKKRK